MREAGNSEFHRRIEALLDQIDERSPVRASAPGRTHRVAVEEAARPAPTRSLDALLAQFDQEIHGVRPSPLTRTHDEAIKEPVPARSAALEELFAQFEEPAPQAAPPALDPALFEDPVPEIADSVLDNAPLDHAPIETAAEALYEVRAAPLGRALFACRPIKAGTRLFGEDDWLDEAERKVFSIVTADQIANLPERLCKVFLHFAYNVTPDKVSGSFLPEAVRHPTNFMNHSCDPNAGYDGVDQIVALRAIAPDEEIRMDYGTYSFSFDHLFTCTCGSLWCRGRVRRDDWRTLVRTGLRLPGFMRELADHALWG